MKPLPPSAVRATLLLAPGAITNGLLDHIAPQVLLEQLTLRHGATPTSSPHGEPDIIFFHVRGHLTGGGYIRPKNCPAPALKSITQPLETSSTALMPPFSSLPLYGHRLPTGRPLLPPRRSPNEILSIQRPKITSPHFRHALGAAPDLPSLPACRIGWLSPPAPHRSKAPLLLGGGLPAHVGWAGQRWAKWNNTLSYFPLYLFESNSNNLNLLKFVVNQLNSTKR
jgi:hypothetical protein